MRPTRRRALSLLPTTLSVLGALLAALLAVPAAQGEAPPSPSSPKEATVSTTGPCPGLLSIPRSESPWRGYTSSYDEEQAGLHVKAAPLASGWEVPTHLAAFVVDGRPLLAIDRSARRVHVDASSFSDLERIDVTGLAPKERKVIGHVKGPAAKLPAERLVEFLLKSQLVITYWHLGAELCPGKPATVAGVYRLGWKGVHEFCTNECQEKAYAFAIEIVLATGEIAVVGE